jgi:phosphatidylserine decarboxylase
MNQNIVLLLLKILPRNLLSRMTGVLVSMKLPPPLGRWSVLCFAKYFRINLNEAEFGIEKYPTIQALFTRRLKVGLRTAKGKLVHPCDSNISSHGRIQSGEVLQAKGLNYSLRELLGEENSEVVDKFIGGYYITYYLCPTDYHRVHSPADWDVQKLRHIPGDLWPVNEASVRKVPKLFSKNERVVGLGNSSSGRLAMVMVGATNVGNIKIAFQAPAKLKVLDEFGTFNMGSTVILVLDSSHKVENITSGPVLLGQAISREVGRELSH